MGAVQIPESMRPLLVDLDKIRQHPDNPNNGDVEEVAHSIQVNGYMAPITVEETTGYILAGNTRYAAMLSLGQKQIPAVFAKKDPDDALRYLIGDNEIARLARMDEAARLAILEHLKEDTELGLLGTGISEHAFIEMLMQTIEAPPDSSAMGFHANEGVYQVIIEFDDEQDMHDLAAELIDRGLDVREVIV